MSSYRRTRAERQAHFERQRPSLEVLAIWVLWLALLERGTDGHGQARTNTDGMVRENGISQRPDPGRSAFRAKNLFKVADAAGRFLVSGLAQEALQGLFLAAFPALLIAPQEPDKRPNGQREPGKTKGDPPAFHDLNVL